MFYYLSKVIWFVLQPTCLFALMTLFGLLLLWTRRVRLGKTLAMSGIVLLLIAGVSPLGNMLILPLEERFPRPSLTDLEKNPPTGIIVLGGAADTSVLIARNADAFNEAAERMTEAVVLAKKFPNAKLIFTGGPSVIFETPVEETISAKRFFEDMGIESSRIILEGKSRNTFENALFTKQMVNPKPGERWLLVTSAFHMPRSMGCFRKVDMAVTAWPVDFRTRGWSDMTRFFSVASEGLRRTDLASKEWVGLVAYWATGKTTGVFPGVK